MMKAQSKEVTDTLTRTGSSLVEPFNRLPTRLRRSFEQKEVDREVRAALLSNGD